MSDNDPRLDVEDRYAHTLATLLMDEREFLRLLDDADRAAGIVRVDTTDEALVERLGEVIYRTDVAMTCVHMSPDDARVHARAVLAALREAAQ